MTDKTIETLLPCPFCGGEAKTGTGYQDLLEIWGAECQECGALGADHKTEKEATKAWNTRIELDPK